MTGAQEGVKKQSYLTVVDVAHIFLGKGTLVLMVLVLHMAVYIIFLRKTNLFNQL